MMKLRFIKFRTEHASKPHSASVGRNLSPCHLNMDGPAVVAGANVSGGLDDRRSDLRLRAAARRSVAN